MIVEIIQMILDDIDSDTIDAWNSQLYDPFGHWRECGRRRSKKNHNHIDALRQCSTNQ